SCPRASSSTKSFPRCRKSKPAAARSSPSTPKAASCPKASPTTPSPFPTATTPPCRSSPPCQCSCSATTSPSPAAATWTSPATSPSPSPSSDAVVLTLPPRESTATPFPAVQLTPSRDEFLRLADQGNVIPVYADLLADFETPVSAYAKLAAAGAPSFLLESVEGGEHLSRYSFLSCRPRKIFACGPDTTEIRVPGQPVQTVPTPADPLTLIEAEMRGCKPVQLPGLPRFTGGAVGFIAYEYVTRIEPTVPVAGPNKLGTPLLYFMISDSLFIFDRAKQTLRLCVNAHLSGGIDSATAYDRAAAELSELHAILARPDA